MVKLILFCVIALSCSPCFSQVSPSDFAQRQQERLDDKIASVITNFDRLLIANGKIDDIFYFDSKEVLNSAMASYSKKWYVTYKLRPDANFNNVGVKINNKLYAEIHIKSNIPIIDLQPDKQPYTPPYPYGLNPNNYPSGHYPNGQPTGRRWRR